MSEKTVSDLLQKLLNAYGDDEPIQDPQESSTDGQLNSITLVIEDLIHKGTRGSILDIGCGKGVLLSKLADVKSFVENKSWMYVGSDFNHLNDILQLAVDLKLHRRCEVIGLDTLYDSWISSIDVSNPLLVFVRNVLHELDIPATSRLLHLLNNNMKLEDTLLIQDLLVFPQAERGNVCWDPECLEDVLRQLGFESSRAIGKTRSGAQWISIKTGKIESSDILSLDEVTDIVARGRSAQLEKWRAVENLPSDTRLNNIAKIDFDLQLAALYRQLDDIDFLDLRLKKDKPTLNPQSAFRLALRRYNSSILDRDQFKLPSISNFRDRATSQDSLESFLTSQDAVVVIRGGASCGKTALIAHVLSRRAHGRSIVPIDCAAANDVWPILEQYLLAIGCQSSLEILSRERHLLFSDLRDALSNFLGNISPKSIVVFDHFERLIDPNGQVMNSEICNFLSLIASADNAKVVITTRKAPLLNFLPQSVGINDEQPPVGRFPEGPYVQNILDDFVDRTSIGLDKYPDELLDAIDRFPYLATLAGKLIAEAGIDAAQDPIILDIIKSYLYDELANKIASPEARPALKLACALRIPTPACLFEDIVGIEATTAAQETGLLFNIPDRYRNDLLSCATVLRDAETSVDSVESDIVEDSAQKEMHAKIAKSYENMSYETQGDPRWIREAHYHYLASGDSTGLHRVGSLYKSELIWAGQTLFRRFHNYKEALEVLVAAETMGLVTYESRMLIASCLIRTGDRKTGESYYQKLIEDFPDQIGIKTSFIDSLLNIRQYSDALHLLERFGFTESNSTAWIMGQFGRANLGLHEYFKAAQAFKIQLKKESKSPAIVFVRLAQAYFRYGDRDKAQESITEGLCAYKDDPVLNALYYANLTRDNSEASLIEAKQKLDGLLVKYPRNGFLLQKLVKVSASLGELQQVLGRLNKINWQVEPTHLVLPIKIAVLLSQKNFKKAVEIASQLPSNEEYADAIIYKIFLSWATTEQNTRKKQEVAKVGVERGLSQNYYKNIPILTMYAQLARIAENEELFEQMITLISEINSEIAKELCSAVPFDGMNFEPEMP